MTRIIATNTTAPRFVIGHYYGDWGEGRMSVILPKGSTARGECDCSHRWSRHDLARTRPGADGHSPVTTVAVHAWRFPKGMPAVVYSAPDFGRLLNEHPELDLYRDSRSPRRTTRSRARGQ